MAVLVVVVWYRGHGLLWGVDTVFPLNVDISANYFHVPDPGIGAPDVRKLAFILPMMGVLRAWAALGLPYNAVVIQPILVWVLFTLSGASVYALVRLLFRRVDRLSAVGAALFYMFNLYALSSVWEAISNLLFHYSLLPLVLIAWLLALRARAFTLAAGAGLVWAMLLTPAYVTTPVALTDSVLFAGVVLAELAGRDQSREKIRILLCGATTYGVWLLVSLFWIIPLGLYSGAVEARGLATGDPTGLFELNSVPLGKALRLAGYWGITSPGGGYPWERYYLDIGVTAAFLVPAVAALSFAGSRLHLRRPVVSEDERRYLLFFGGMLVVAIFALTGARSPVGSLKVALFDEAGLTASFRSVYQRFGGYAALAYAPLIALGLCTGASAIRERAGGRFGSRFATGATIVVIAGIALLPALPLWTGSAFDASGIMSSHRVDIPPPYERLASTIDRTPGDFTVMTFPFGRAGSVTALNWDRGRSGYLGVEPFSLLLSKPLVTGDPAAPYIADLAEQVARGGPGAARALRALNVRYVIVHNDVNQRFLDLPNVSHQIGRNVDLVSTRLARTPGLTRLEALPGLTVFRVNNWLPFRVFVERKSSRRHPVSSRPTVELKAIPYSTPDRYRVHIAAGVLEKGDLLVLNHPFDSKWRASGAHPVRVEAGLTGFRIGNDGEVDISHVVDQRFRQGLALLPLLGLLCVAGLVAGTIHRRRH